MKHNLILAKEPKVLHEYINGNTRVTIYDDGTKIRETDDEFSPIFPEILQKRIPTRWKPISAEPCLLISKTKITLRHFLCTIT